jgi:hypothetical protein
VTRLNILANQLAVARDAMRIASRQAADTEHEIVSLLGLDDCGHRIVQTEDYRVEAARVRNGTAFVSVEKRRELYPCCEG